MTDTNTVTSAEPHPSDFASTSDWYEAWVAWLGPLPDMSALDYDPLSEGWVCGDHGIDACTALECVDLPWPQPNDPRLNDFHDWVESKFRPIIRPYDEADPPRELPDEAFRSYSVNEWLAERSATQETSA